MDPITIGILAGAGLGLLKGQQDKKREAADRKVAAETARWSPWTGMTPEAVQRSDMMGSTMQGGLAGASMGQGVANQQAYGGYMDALRRQQDASRAPIWQGDMMISPAAQRTV